MDKRINQIYTCCINNKVIVVDTNLEAFYKQLKALGIIDITYWGFYKNFKDRSALTIVKDSKTYYLQKNL
ncbi:hypothetical protein C7H61_00820 [Mesoflavibacter zeaxanthinifaciens subsp. sabulilitoris]|uniref:Uncharacterized protein n=1 Tax=Mesoflavibacter zeaxanthinifaciens subsp. sabulilitoris TaxID=1520893 RepID=A0A2T1NNP1_9FLAO|nr:hypothetical protein C7H61_00820 [Mesoflavibacter zeaxanthinifaciens subsp. sabulilitoris]